MTKIKSDIPRRKPRPGWREVLAYARRHPLFNTRTNPRRFVYTLDWDASETIDAFLDLLAERRYCVKVTPVQGEAFDAIALIHNGRPVLWPCIGDEGEIDPSKTPFSLNLEEVDAIHVY